MPLLHLALIIAASLILFIPLALLLGYITTITHEMGHAIAARCYGLRIMEVCIHPWVGSCTYMRSGPAMRRTPERIELESLVITVSGPGANFLLCLVCFFSMMLSLPSYAIILLCTLATFNLVIGLINVIGIGVEDDPDQDAVKIREHYRNWKRLKPQRTTC